MAMARYKRLVDRYATDICSDVLVPGNADLC